MRALLLRITAFILIPVGLVGLVLPIIPGIPLLLLAAFLLGRDAPGLRRRIAAYRPLARLGGTIRSCWRRLQLQFWLAARRVVNAARGGAG